MNIFECVTTLDSSEDEGDYEDDGLSMIDNQLQTKIQKLKRNAKLRSMGIIDAPTHSSKGSKGSKGSNRSNRSRPPVPSQRPPPIKTRKFDSDNEALSNRSLKRVHFDGKSPKKDKNKNESKTETNTIKP